MTPLPSPALAKHSQRRRRALRVLTFLAPNLFGLYDFVTRHIGARLGVATELAVGSSYRQLAEADLAFVCGLPYVEAVRRGEPLEPLAAPVLRGSRYAGKPIYFSDVVVRRDSPHRKFADLRGQAWAYNEPQSQSGHGIVRHHLARHGETHAYFGRVVESGWHERSLAMIVSGAVDASAIDSHVLAVALRDRPALAGQLRIIDTLGPSTIQPLVARQDLPERLKVAIQTLLAGLHRDPAALPCLEQALVEKFVAVRDEDYDDIRRMQEVAAMK